MKVVGIADLLVCVRITGIGVDLEQVPIERLKVKSCDQSINQLINQSHTNTAAKKVGTAKLQCYFTKNNALVCYA